MDCFFPPPHTRDKCCAKTSESIVDSTGINISTGDKDFNHLPDRGLNIPMLVFQIGHKVKLYSKHVIRYSC